MKPWLVLSLLSPLVLVGCIEEPETSDGSSSQSYGLTYSGQTSWAMLETMAEVEAFVKVFELHHRNQALIDNWPTQLIELTPDADVNDLILAHAVIRIRLYLIFNLPVVVSKPVNQKWRKNLQRRKRLKKPGLIIK